MITARSTFIRLKNHATVDGARPCEEVPSRLAFGGLVPQSLREVSRLPRQPVVTQ